MPSLAEAIKQQARDLGFSAVGIAPARPLPFHARAFRRYVAEGRYAGMVYLANEPDRREDPRRLLPGARTVIAVALPYYQGDHGPAPAESGRVARYAWGRDYHAVLGARLERLRDFILERAPNARVRCAVDHAPILERAYAQEAGLGFIGKHGVLITTGHGSWVVLGEVITDLALPFDAPATNQCGSCTKCLEACPTGALTAPFQLDAARCVAYLTIEHKGPMPSEHAAGVGDWLFGCDVCQEVCPYNHRPVGEPPADLASEQGPGPWLPLADAAAHRSHGAFDRRFAGSPLHRAGKRGLQRNAAVVASNRRRGATDVSDRATALPMVLPNDAAGALGQTAGPAPNAAPDPSHPAPAGTAPARR